MFHDEKPFKTTSRSQVKKRRKKKCLASNHKNEKFTWWKKMSRMIMTSFSIPQRMKTVTFIFETCLHIFFKKNIRKSENERKTRSEFDCHRSIFFSISLWWTITFLVFAWFACSKITNCWNMFSDIFVKTLSIKTWVTSEAVCLISYRCWCCPSSPFDMSPFHDLSPLFLL